MTAEQLHDALSLLPSDLIAAADKLRTAPRKAVIYWRKYAAIAACAVLVLGCGLLFMDKAFPSTGGGSKECAIAGDALLSVQQEAPAAPAEIPEPEAAGAVTDASANEVLDTLTDNAPPAAMEEADEGLLPTGYPAEGGYYIDMSAVHTCLTQPLPSVNLRSENTEAVILRSESELENYRQERAATHEMAAFAEYCGSFEADWFAAYDLLVIRVSSEKSELIPTILGMTLTGPAACEISLAYAQMPEDNILDPTCWHILLPVEKGLLPEDTIIHIVN